MKVKYLFFSVLLTAIFFGCQPKEKYELSLNLDVGEKYTLQQETTQNFFQRVMGVEHQIEHKYLVIYSLIVEDYDDDEYILTFEYEEVAMEVKSPDVNISSGSADHYDKSDTLNLVLKALTQKPFKISMSKYGEINSVYGMEEFLEHVINDLDFFQAGEEHEAIAALEQFIGESGFHDNLNQLVGYLPQKPVSLRDKWENSFNQTVIGIEGNWENIWRLVEMDDEISIVEGKSEYKVTDEDTPVNLAEDLNYADMGIEVDIDGSQQIHHTIDRKTGLIRSGEISSLIEGIFSPGQEAEVMTLQVRLEVSSKINQIKQTDAL